MSNPGLDSHVPSGWRSDRVGGVSGVHFLPHHRAAHAEEVPQVTDNSAVKRVLLVTEVLQVGDPVAWHELPGGAADGDQVQVAAQQQHHHHGEDPHHTQRRQQEPVHSEPLLPGEGGGDARQSDV